MQNAGQDVKVSHRTGNEEEVLSHLIECSIREANTKRDDDTTSFSGLYDNFCGVFAESIDPARKFVKNEIIRLTTSAKTGMPAISWMPTSFFAAVARTYVTDCGLLSDETLFNFVGTFDSTPIISWAAKKGYKVIYSCVWSKIGEVELLTFCIILKIHPNGSELFSPPLKQIIILKERRGKSSVQKSIGNCNFKLETNEDNDNDDEEDNDEEDNDEEDNDEEDNDEEDNDEDNDED
jgi:hypothetical protein